MRAPSCKTVYEQRWDSGSFRLLGVAIEGLAEKSTVLLQLLKRWIIHLSHSHSHSSPWNFQLLPTNSTFHNLSPFSPLGDRSHSKDCKDKTGLPVQTYIIPSELLPLLAIMHKFFHFLHSHSMLSYKITHQKNYCTIFSSLSYTLFTTLALSILSACPYHLKILSSNFWFELQPNLCCGT